MRHIVKALFLAFLLSTVPVMVNGHSESERQSGIISQVNSGSSFSWLTTDSNSLKNDIENLPLEFLYSFTSGDYERAISQTLQLVEYTKINRPTEYVQLATWMNVLALSYLNIGDCNKSEECYLTALETLESHNLQEKKLYRVVLDALSVLYTKLHNYDKARLLNNKAKSLYEEVLDLGADYIRCLCNGALIQNALGYKIVAKMQLDVALRQAKKIFSDTTAISPLMIPSGQFWGQYIDTTSLDRNYYIHTRVLPYITLLSNSSAIYSYFGYFSDAIRTVKESIQLSEEYGLKEAMPYNNLGSLYFIKSRFSQAKEWVLKGYSLCKTQYEKEDIGMNAVIVMLLSNDDRMASFASDISSSMRQNVQDVFAFLNTTERSNYWKHFDFYLPMINLAIYESGKDEYFGAIYDNILGSKGLLLRSTNNIRDAVLNSENQEDKNIYNRLGYLRQQLYRETDSLKRIELVNEIEQLDKTLTRNVSAYADFAKRNNISWIDVRDALSNKDIAIEFYNIPLLLGRDSIQTMVEEPRYCAVVLKKGYEYPHIIPLCKEAQLDELEDYDFYGTDSIYNMIWRSLEQELRGVENIYFAAERGLHKIGIEYALLPDAKRMDEKYAIYRLSSTRELVDADRHSSNTIQHTVLYGGLRYDVDMDDLVEESRGGQYHAIRASRSTNMDNLRYGVHYLPGTLKEVQNISSTLNGNYRLITDITGTEESFKSLSGKSVDVIHLATHGFFWSEVEAEKRSYVNFLNKSDVINQSFEDNALLRSGLFFSGANIGLRGEDLPEDVEDGVLTARELADMNLGNVDMVVMSACQSGLGEISGDGVFGLQRGFKLAGAKTLLMSLWKVDDEATELLMSDFYSHYLSGKSKQESLKLAQQTLRNNPKYSDYEYWAAFILLDALN